MVYVIGTTTVGIKTSPIVDSSGRVTIKLPFFFWDPDEPYPATAIVTLVDAIATAFGKAIPVYSRSQGDDTPRASQVTAEQLVSRAALVKAIEKKVAVKRHMLESGERSEIAKLRQTQQKLQASKQYVSTAMERATREIASATNATTELKGVLGDLDAALVTAQEVHDAPVDDLVEATAPLHRQMMHLMAEIAALEDVLITLTHALRSDEVKIEDFLRLTREVLLKQFNARVLLLKARDVAVTAYQ